LRDRAIAEKLIELIREGKAPRVILRRGAQGALPVAPQEKIEILVALASSPDQTLRDKALETLRQGDSRELQQVLCAPSTDPLVLEFAAKHLGKGRHDILEALLQNPSLPEEVRNEIQVILLCEAEAEAAAEGSAVDQDTRAIEDRDTLIQRISRMTTVERIKLALIGNLETRMLLIRDPNKLVARTVLQSPKITEPEIESYAASTSVSEDVLRRIALNRGLIKKYNVMRALISNPRAPIDITFPLLGRLNDRDMKWLSMNRNVPEIIRSTALKISRQREEALKPKIPSRRF
jgi:hypothetical protein